MNAPFDMVTHLAAAQMIVENSPHWQKFIDGTPLSNDIAVWMAEFARASVEETTDQIKYLEAAHRIGAENVASTRRELAELRAGRCC